MYQQLESQSDRKAFIQVDALLALSFTFIFIFTLYSFFTSQIEESEKETILLDLETLSEDLCSQFISSSGFPSNWFNNVSQVQVIGFRNSNSSELNSSKLAACVNANYFAIKESLGLESEQFYVNIRGLNTDTLYLECGSDIPIEAYFSQSRCYAPYSGEIASVEVKVWR